MAGADLRSAAAAFEQGDRWPIRAGIDVQDDGRGRRATRAQPWFPGETLVAGIGQGYVLATPLQLAVMTARIANGGLAVVPRLGRETVADDSPARPPGAFPPL